MSREISNEAILQEIYAWTASFDGSQESLEKMRGAIIDLCHCSEDVEKREEFLGEVED